MPSVAPPLPDLLAISPERQSAISELATHLRPGLRVALSTHVNADGDGCGSEAALARLLAQMGIEARIVNPTPWPDMFRFLLADDVTDASGRGPAALRDVDVLIVLDISDVSRLGALSDTVRALTIPKLVIDHHIATDEPAGSVVVADTTACATGERAFRTAAVAVRVHVRGDRHATTILELLREPLDRFAAVLRYVYRVR